MKRAASVGAPLISARRNQSLSIKFIHFRGSPTNAGTGRNLMATFATCQNSNGQRFWINVDLVRVVEHNSQNNHSTLAFDDDHKVTVQGEPDVILGANKTGYSKGRPVF